MADDRDTGARRALPGEGTGMSGVEGLAEQLAVAVQALEKIGGGSSERVRMSAELAFRVARTALDSLRCAA